MLATLIVAALLGAEPQAAMVAVGPTTVPVGSQVFFNAEKSVSDFPLVWAVSPAEKTMVLTYDKNGRVGVDAGVIGGDAGDYDVVLVASGWSDDAKTHVAVSVDTQKIVFQPLGPPVPPKPPIPPLPTDPLSQAAANLEKDLIAAYSTGYAAFVSSIQARNPLVPARATLSTGITKAVNDSFTRNFAQWIPLMPPANQEPNTESQWQNVYQVYSAIAKEFGQ